MCEINPKRKKFFRVEVFTAHKMSDERWNSMLETCMEHLLSMEMLMNASGEFRIHVHEAEK